MYADTITLFNFYDGKWYRNTLRNVDLNTDLRIMRQTLGDNAADNCLLHIRYAESGDNKYVGACRVVLPGEYSGASNTICFAMGENASFFIVGAWAPSNNSYYVNDDDYRLGFYDYMNANYQDVYTIKSVACYSVIPHYEITAG